MRSCFFKSIAQDRLDRKLRIPEEPENSDPNSIRVLIKLPNGKRLERRFLKSHSLQVRIFSILFFFNSRPVGLVDLLRRVIFSWQMVLIIDDFTWKTCWAEQNVNNRTPIYQIRSAVCYTL